MDVVFTPQILARRVQGGAVRAMPFERRRPGFRLGGAARVSRRLLSTLSAVLLASPAVARVQAHTAPAETAVTDAARALFAARTPSCAACQRMVCHLDDVLLPRSFEERAKTRSSPSSGYGRFDAMVEEEVSASCSASSIQLSRDARKECERLLETREEEIVRLWFDRVTQDDEWNMNWLACSSGGAAFGGSGGRAGAGIAGDAEARVSAGIGEVRFDDVVVVAGSGGRGEGPSRRLLDGVSGTCRRGELLGLLGPSGAGKSTLLNVVAGRVDLVRGMRQTGGVVSLDGVPTRSRRLSRRVAYVPQHDTHLPPYLTVFETVMYSAELQLPWFTSKGDKRAKALATNALDAVGQPGRPRRWTLNWNSSKVS